MDVSYWLPTSSDPDSIRSDVMDVIREVGGDLVEQAKLIDQFESKKKQKTSQCYRIVYRSNERPLTKDEGRVHAFLRFQLLANSKILPDAVYSVVFKCRRLTQFENRNTFKASAHSVQLRNG